MLHFLFSVKDFPKSLEIAGSLLWWKLRKVLSSKQAWRYPWGPGIRRVAEGCSVGCFTDL